MIVKITFNAVENWFQTIFHFVAVLLLSGVPRKHRQKQRCAAFTPCCYQSQICSVLSRDTLPLALYESWNICVKVMLLSLVYLLVYQFSCYQSKLRWQPVTATLALIDRKLLVTQLVWNRLFSTVDKISNFGLQINLTSRPCSDYWEGRCSDPLLPKEKSFPRSPI